MPVDAQHDRTSARSYCQATSSRCRPHHPRRPSEVPGRAVRRAVCTVRRRSHIRPTRQPPRTPAPVLTSSQHRVGCYRTLVWVAGGLVVVLGAACDASPPESTSAPVSSAIPHLQPHRRSQPPPTVLRPRRPRAAAVPRSNRLAALRPVLLPDRPAVPLAALLPDRPAVLPRDRPAALPPVLPPDRPAAPAPDPLMNRLPTPTVRPLVRQVPHRCAGANLVTAPGLTATMTVSPVNKRSRPARSRSEAKRAHRPQRLATEPPKTAGPNP